METVLITGGTGMIGRQLSKALLKKGYAVVILTREIPNSKKQTDPDIQFALWDIEKQTIDKEAIVKADHIIHLAGANVGEKRWTSKRKKEILESRTISSTLLVEALGKYPNKVRTIVSASAIGWYIPDDDETKVKPEGWKGSKEDEPADQSFLGDTVRLWEESIEPVTQLGKRLVKLRIGIVLSKKGGALDEFRKPLKFGFATILGRGKQVISWIHIDDLVRMYIFALENEKLNGTYNAVSPQPATNKSFVLQLAKEVKGKFFFPLYIPSFFLKTVLGEMSVEVLKSATVSCEKIKKAGFEFSYPKLADAIKHLHDPNDKH